MTVKLATEAYGRLNAIKAEFQKGMSGVLQSAQVGSEFDMDKYYNGLGELHAKFLDRYLKFAKDNAKDSSAGEAQQLIRQMVAGMANSGSPQVGEKLRSLLSKSQDKELLGQANLALGQHLAKRYEQAFQKKEPGASKFAKEAEGILQQTAKDFASLKGQAEEAVFDLTKLAVGKKAMEIQAEDLDGKTFKLSDYRGKVVVIDFWGNW